MWIKKMLLRLLAGLGKKHAADLAIYLLSLVDPHQLAEKADPAIRKLFAKMGMKWKKAFKEAWDKIDALMDKLLE